ncbi:MAG TPA: hypothetical protein VNZ26_12640 [Vicinamibacterales bacterium]|jgi:hypothetical protein|nr:hypothetical protein [Vicinamibacterales bacterium]
MRYTVVFHHFIPGAAFVDAKADPDVTFHSDSPIPLPDVGDVVVYKQNGAQAQRKVHSRHLSYTQDSCVATITVENIP